MMDHMADFFLNCSGVMNYSDSAIGNGILSLHYQIRGRFLNKLGEGKCVNFLCKLNIFMLANTSIKDD